MKFSVLEQKESFSETISHFSQQIFVLTAVCLSYMGVHWRIKPKRILQRIENLFGSKVPHKCINFLQNFRYLYGKS